VINHLQADAADLGLSKGAGGVAVERGQASRLISALSCFGGFCRGRLRRGIGVADERAFFVVCVNEPNAIRRLRRADFAGLWVEDSAVDLDWI